MATRAEMVEIACPRCGEEFAGWDRPSVDPPATAVCPRCRHKLAQDPGLREDGYWSLTGDEETRDRAVS